MPSLGHQNRTKLAKCQAWASKMDKFGSKMDKFGAKTGKFGLKTGKGAVAIRDSTTQEGAGRFLSRLLVDLET